MTSTILLAGGGTGGHVFPLVAVAHALRRLHPGLRPICVGTARGMETKFVPAQGLDLELLEVLPIRGGGARGVARGVAQALRMLPASMRLLDRYQPRAVFSVGGYAAGPVSLAARLRGLPVGLLEPNSAIGLANWLIAPFVQRAYTAFEPVERHFAPAAIRALGVPIRDGFEPRSYGPGETLRVLVLGGSQGAKSLNEALPEALAAVDAPLRVLHQCGAAHIDDVKARYAAIGASFAEVTPFIDDMSRALAQSDLVVGRAGASAVSEIAAVGRPSLLVPYPYASGDHQMLNARCLEGLGAAVCVPSAAATPARLREEIQRLARDRSRLRAMATAAARFGRPHAATNVARDLLQLAELPIEASTLGSSTPGGSSLPGARSSTKPLAEVA